MNKRGFIIIEIMVVFIIIGTLFAIGYVQANRTLRRAPLTATVETIIADLRAQQTQAMAGKNAGGITFQSDSYTLVGGSIIPLPEHIFVSGITFPLATVTFAVGSGEVVGFTTGSNTLTLSEDITGEQKIITINRYGSVTQIQ